MAFHPTVGPCTVGGSVSTGVAAVEPVVGVVGREMGSVLCTSEVSPCIETLCTHVVSASALSIGTVTYVTPGVADCRSAGCRCWLTGNGLMGLRLWTVTADLCSLV